MGKNITLDLPMDNKKLFMNTSTIEKKKEVLEKFIEDESKMKTKSFVKTVLPTNEVQSNNMVEGYFDDISDIRKIVRSKNSYRATKDEQQRRIFNLVSGYNYILKGEEINKENLKKLYSILSKNLLSSEDIKKMGEYYRDAPVYIFYSSNMSKEPDTGVPKELVEDKMNHLFKFINEFETDGTMTDEFIKSQILHFYFVYIHPYFDINGRTARTTSIWHLLNEKTYPFVIFNRGIQINKSEYYKVIRDIKRFGNINFFINYMFDNVLLELKKEHVMQSIKESCNEKLTATDYQTLHYLLSINGLCTALDFVNMYNNCNEKRRPYELQKEMLEPLIEKKIIIPGRNTNKNITNDISNYTIDLNMNFVDDSKDLSGIQLLKK